MNIVFNALNFSPEIVGNAKYTSELVYWLSNYANKIIVITTNPYYPEWECHFNRYKKEIKKNIIIYRCPIYVPKRVNGFTKILHYLSFLITSLPVGIISTKYKPDLIFTICPTIFSIPTTVLISFLTRIFSKKKVLKWIHYQDLEIEAAFDLNILKGVYLKKLVLCIEKFVLNKFNIVSTISYGMMEKLKNKVLRSENLYFLPNFIDTKKYAVDYKNKKENPFFDQLKLNSNNYVVMYSGTLNEKLSYEVLINSIYSLKKYKDIVWIISGDGPLKKFLINKLDNLENVKFMPFQDKEILPTWLNIADIHLIPQKISVSNLVLPSKLLGILCSSKPVIGIAKKNSDLDKILSYVGISINSEDPELLSNSILKLIKNNKLRKELSEKGFKYVEKFYEKETVLSKLISEIRDLDVLN